MWVPGKECWLKTGSAASRTQQGYFFIPQNENPEKMIIQKDKGEGTSSLQYVGLDA